VLAVLAAVSFATGDLKAALVMLSMIVLSAGLRFWQEMKSQVQAESLRKLVHNEATVLRAENKDEVRKPNELDRLASDIPTRELVPGDLVKLSAGDMIPADLRLLNAFRTPAQLRLIFEEFFWLECGIALKRAQGPGDARNRFRSQRSRAGSGSRPCSLR
jgi:hypothetical protein